MFPYSKGREGEEGKTGRNGKGAKEERDLTRGEVCSVYLHILGTYLVYLFYRSMWAARAGGREGEEKGRKGREGSIGKDLTRVEVCSVYLHLLGTYLVY